jgi:vanillate O-demethylase monooxygenase subunit
VADPSLDVALAYFWHPVCTLDELDAARPHPLAVRLLDRALAVADVGGSSERCVVAVVDRCPHRSTKLSAGVIEAGALRCAYHGWRFDRAGRCTEIPSLPAGVIPERACVAAFDAEVAYDLVWVRLDPAASTVIPVNPAWSDTSMKSLAGRTYTWPTSAPRRVENFVDLAHFAWVHDGTLGRRSDPVPPIPKVRREGGELRFEYDPPPLDAAATALYGASRYRMPMPLTVDIEFELPSGAHRRLWMTASPVDARTCRSFWFVSRDDDLDGDDAAHLAFQDLVLAEDEPVVCNQDPPELPLGDESPLREISVRTDRVSIEYRRWLRELVDASTRSGPAAAVRAALDRADVDGASPAPTHVAVSA